MDTYVAKNNTRGTAVNVLAGVGFVALVGVGIWLAVYSTRFIPVVVNGMSEAAVYLGAVFSPAPAPALSVVPAAGTTTGVTAAATAAPAGTTALEPVSTASGTKTRKTYQIAGASATVAPHGLPDLAVTVTAVGYFKDASTDSFVASTTVPSGYQPAIQFTIKNVGTNWTGTWRFSASIPTRRSYVFESDPQQSLAAGESIDYTLGFDQATAGTQQLATITANFDHVVQDKNTANDSAVAYLNVL